MTHGLRVAGGDRLGKTIIFANNSDLLHADDTPIRVLDRSQWDKGLGKGVKKGRTWAYVRDQRPWAGKAPPGAVYRFAANWEEEHVREHLGEARHFGVTCSCLVSTAACISVDE